MRTANKCSHTISIDNDVCVCVWGGGVTSLRGYSFVEKKRSSLFERLGLYEHVIHQRM